jgi:hypothetical protein
MSTTTQSSGTGPAYAQRALDISLTLGEGQFGQSGSNTIKMSGLRVIATVQKSGLPSFDRAEIRVYGVQPAVMNAASVQNVPLTQFRPNNDVLLEAGTIGGSMQTVFQGPIGFGWQVLDGAESFFQIVAWSGARGAAMTPPAQPLSVQGSTNVAQVMASLAKSAGFNFQNDGVDVTLASTYFPGTLTDQIFNLARAADINAYIDSSTSPNTLVIWPKLMTRSGNAPLLSPETGLIGYPKFYDQGAQFRCLFNPNIRLGAPIQVQSSLPPASGQWMVIGPLTHNISAQQPNGPWFTDLSCARTLVPAASS